MEVNSLNLTDIFVAQLLCTYGLIGKKMKTSEGCTHFCSYLFLIPSIVERIALRKGSVGLLPSNMASDLFSQLHNFFGMTVILNWIPGLIFRRERGQEKIIFSLSS